MDIFKFAIKYLRPARFIPGLAFLFDCALLSWYVVFDGKRVTMIEDVEQTALSWPGVTKALHRFGGTEFRLGNREIGHLHGNGLLDIPFPKAVREQLVRDGQASPHHIYPQSGWISFRIRSEADAPNAIHLLRLAYERRQKLIQE